MYEAYQPHYTLHILPIIMSNDGTIADKIPRGLRVLNKKHNLFGGIVVPSHTMKMTTELQQLQQEATSIEQWWSQPRWKYTKRNYTGTFPYRGRCFRFSNIFIHTHFTLLRFYFFFTFFCRSLSDGCRLFTSIVRSTRWKPRQLTGTQRVVVIPTSGQVIHIVATASQSGRVFTYVWCVGSRPSHADGTTFIIDLYFRMAVQ